MGLCQGRTRARLTARILAEEENTKASELSPPSKRPLTRPIEIESLARAKENES